MTRSAPVRVGDRAPDFTLLSQDGTPVRLSDRLGAGPLVLYFYPKDGSPGCTAEACAFSDRYETFAAAGAQVLGVSTDSVESHARFAARHRLPFTLLSDPDGAVHSRYGVAKRLGVIPRRVTYVIDPQGVVRIEFSSLARATQHVTEALALIQRLRGEHDAADS